MQRSSSLYNFSYFFLLFLIFSLGSCLPDFDIYEPEVMTSNIYALPDGRIVVEGEIVYLERVSGGLFVGFDYSLDSSDFPITNQFLIRNPDSVQFSKIYTDLVPLQTYYFRSFIANGYNYTYGDIIEYTVPFGEDPEVPCEISENIIADNGANCTINIESIQQGGRGVTRHRGNYAVRFTCSGGGVHNVHMEWSEAPVTGIYSTRHYSNFDQNRGKIILIELTSSNIFSVKPDGEVYVTFLDANTMKVEFCDLRYGFSDTGVPISGHVIVER